MATLKEIAQKAGVSTTTVSKVLGGLEKEGRISPERAREIRRIADKMGYIPHASARATRTRKTFHIGVLLRNAPQSPNFIMAHFETLLGINHRLAPDNYVTSLVRFSDVEANMREQSRVFRERVVDGLITLSTCIDPVNAFLSERFENIIWVDGTIRGPLGCLWRDEREAGRLVARNLIDGGCERLVYVTTVTSPHYSHAQREEGILAGADGMPVRILRMSGNRRDLNENGLADELLREIATPRTAVAAYCYLTAQSVLAHLATRGKTPGRDYTLAACDESNDIRMAMPCVSRCAFDRFDMGRQAADMILESFKNGAPPPSRILPASWIPGDTARFL